MPSCPKAAAITMPPDWVCEVVSPSTGTLDRVRKMPVYAREGVRHAWLVDPLDRTVEVFRLERGAWAAIGTHTGDEMLRAEPFDALEIDLLALWGESRT